MSSGLRATYDRDFNQVVDNILKLGTRSTRRYLRALKSLQERDQTLAQQIISDDEHINQLRFEIEEACLMLIATQQPTAGDLRTVIAAMNIVVDIERMADHAAGIAKTVIRMGDEPLLKPLIDIPRMAQLAREMLRPPWMPLSTWRCTEGAGYGRIDEDIDHLYRAIFDELVEIMAHKPEGVERATYLLWCAHNLERIGDRVTNIAERVIFMTTGDMRELNT